MNKPITNPTDAPSLPLTEAPTIVVNNKKNTEMMQP